MIKLLITTLFTPLLCLANTIEVKGTAPLTQCSQLEGRLTAVNKPFKDGPYSGTLVGYEFLKAPVFYKLITHDNEIGNIHISKRPRTEQVHGGCFLSFTADSPPGFDFTPPSVRQKAGRRGNLIVAQATPQE